MKCFHDWTDNQWCGPCPKCGDKNPSLTREDEQAYEQRLQEAFANANLRNWAGIRFVLPAGRNRQERRANAARQRAA